MEANDPGEVCKRCAYLCPIVRMNSTLVSLGWRASCSEVQPKVSRMWSNSPKVCNRVEYRYRRLRGKWRRTPAADFYDVGWTALICGAVARGEVCHGVSSARLKIWLGGLDSNQDSQIQNLESCQLDDLPAVVRDVFRSQRGPTKTNRSTFPSSGQLRFNSFRLNGFSASVNQPAAAFRRPFLSSSGQSPPFRRAPSAEIRIRPR